MHKEDALSAEAAGGWASQAEISEETETFSDRCAYRDQQDEVADRAKRSWDSLEWEEGGRPQA